ncbi:hypothetical protein FACS1894126_6240 [Alphaproteobacteria bacterium]|nr:hypothetical protein FACS1894126_6240 [Alphaproteobacteria bacterium]
MVDCDPRVQPDIVADINLIQAQDFGPELYDSVINEHVGASFDRLTLFGVMSLLRIGGQYVSPLLPRLRPEGKHRPDVAMNRPYRIFHFGTGTCYLQDGDLSDVYVDRKTYKTYANTPLAFFNCCAAYFGEYCGLDPTKFKIEFKTVKPGSAEWPHLYDTVRKDVMVVTRLK